MNLDKLNKINIMNKFGVQQRCLNKDSKLSELMLLSVKYVNKLFYVLGDDNYYHGCISLKKIIDLDYEYIKSDPTLLDIVNNMEESNPFYIFAGGGVL